MDSQRLHQLEAAWTRERVVYRIPSTIEFTGHRLASFWNTSPLGIHAAPQTFRIEPAVRRFVTLTALAE